MEQKDRNLLIVVGVVIVVALIAFNFQNITGQAITEPSSLSVFQEGKEVTVQINYPAGKYGKQNNIVDMTMQEGTKNYDQTTKCDTTRGFVSRGTSSCKREIAVFYISGDTWKPGDVVVFNVRGTDINTVYTIR